MVLVFEGSLYSGNTDICGVLIFMESLCSMGLYIHGFSFSMSPHIHGMLVLDGYSFTESLCSIGP